MRTKIESEEKKKKKKKKKRTECTPISTPCHAELQPNSGGRLKRRRRRDVREGVRMKTEIESKEKKNRVGGRERERDRENK